MGTLDDVDLSEFDEETSRQGPAPRILRAHTRMSDTQRVKVAAALRAGRSHTAVARVITRWANDGNWDLGGDVSSAMVSRYLDDLLDVRDSDTV